MPEVSAALGVMPWSMERQRDGPRRSDEPTELVSTVGVDGDPTLIPDAIVLQQGRWLRRADEIVLGAKLSREKGIGVDDTIRLNGRDFRVVGIGRLRAFGFGLGGDGLAYMDYRALQQRADIGDVFTIVGVDTPRPEGVRQRAPEIGSLSTFDPAQLVVLAEAANSSGLAFYWTMIILTLAIAALFVGNVLGRSVAERRIEFATLRAIGIPARTILFTVGAEAALITIAAGFFGILLSLFFGLLINSLMAPQFGIESLYSADAGLFLLIFGLAFALGIAAGIFPARQATRVDPVDVLREA
jgi:putative ABC transport system permease protein